jgi:hypothetical protein
MSTVTEEQIGQFSSEPRRCQCLDCVEVRSRAIKLPDPLFWRGDEKHGSGTIIHWDWRDPDNRKNLILITCHECGHDRFVRKQSILYRWKGERAWRGLCSLDAQLPVRRILKGKHKNPFGAILDFDKSPHDHNRAWAYCPNYSTCGGLEQRRVDKYNKDTQPFYCSNCLSATRRSSLTQAWRSLKVGNGQKNGGSGSRSQGRPQTDITKRIREAVKAVAAEWTLMKNNGKTCEQQAARITQSDLLPYLSSIKKKTGAYDQKNKRLYSWFTKCRLRDMFPDVASPFDSFVQTVVAQLRDGVSEEKIASSLESRLNSALAAA